jgi:cobalt/nickel transport system permease protein
LPIIDQPANLTHGASAISRLDPRTRIVAALVFSLLLALSNRFAVLGLGLAVALAAVLAARLKPGATLRRLAALNGFMLLLLAVLPWSVPGAVLWKCGPLAITREGLCLAAAIALKGNAIVLLLMVLLGTLDIVTMGHALRHLYVPEKLTHLLLFTVRYIDVLEREFQRLTAAMRIRGFRARVSWHTYRSYGYLVGMLLVRSLERAERIVAAMKCRGFRGRFYLLDHFHFSRADLRFGLTSAVVFTTLMLFEWWT